MKQISCLLICLLFLSCMTSCSENNNGDVVSYALEYDVFVEKMEQVIGVDKMFTSMEKISSHKSYDNNYTDLFTLTSMLFEREYEMSIIYEGNLIKSIDIYGNRNILGNEQYSANPDYIVLAASVYQILNEQSDAYGIMVAEFNMNSQDAEIMEIESSNNWIMIYSAKDECISFRFQLKGELSVN